MNPVPPRYYRRFCVYGRNANHLIASVALRAPRRAEGFAPELPYVVLDEVWTHAAHRWQGYATELLSLAKSEAERHQWCVYARPQAHDGGPSQRQLEAFYRARGFGELYRMRPWLGYFPSSVGHAGTA